MYFATLVLFLSLTCPSRSLNLDHLENQCGTGYQQSPINIKGFIPFIEEPNMKFINFDNKPVGQTLWNHGNVHLEFNWGEVERPTVVSTMTRQNFTFDSLHFHWGPTNDRGSEHRIMGLSWPTEAHMVFVDSTKRTLSEALSDKAGEKVLVIGSFGSLVHENKHRLPIATYFNHVRNENATRPINPIDFLTLAYFLPNKIKMNNHYYYHYYGSITTPPCTEPINWIVFEDCWFLSEADIKAFRTILTTNETNYRDTQPGSRVVWKYKYIPEK